MIDTIPKHIQDRVDELQKEMHSMIEWITKNQYSGRVSYQDAVTIYFLVKVAELEESIGKLLNAHAYPEAHDEFLNEHSEEDLTDYTDEKNETTP